MIDYRQDLRPQASEIAALYDASSLRRPTGDLSRIAAMYAGSNLVLSAWDGDRLVGILRGWTDGTFDGYVCDLAVEPGVQGEGVGRKLLDLARAANPEVQFVLRASKLAADYYAHLGWRKIENGWYWPRTGWQPPATP